jgi:ATP-dependent RNA helicase RhlE
LDKTTSFLDLKLIDPLLKAVKQSGYSQPTPIQVQAIPALLERNDLLGCAQTGTGKTAAFSLPLLQNLYASPKKLLPKQPRVLVLTPTRELAIQVHDSFKTYGSFLDIKTSVIFGGVGQSPQVKSIAAGVEVLVATPGRLLDLIQQRFVDLRGVEVFVLDEADRMLDMGFINDIKRIISSLPAKRHNLFFSATMPPEIERLASSILSNPVKIEITPESTSVELIQQSVMYVEKEKKRDLLKHLFETLPLKRVIIFSRTKYGADKISLFLSKIGIKNLSIHGNKSQSARQTALSDFKKGRLQALIATDIAARGIDVDDITHVINYDLPNEPETYVHRIGRTARAGTSGISISFCDGEERAFLRQIEKLIHKSIELDKNQPFHSLEVENFKPMSPGKAKALIDQRSTTSRVHRGRGSARPPRSRR